MAPHMDRPRHPVNAPRTGRNPASASAIGPVVVAPRPGARAAIAGALMAAALVLGACSLFAPPVIDRGNRITEEQLKEVNAGVHTRADVQALLGSPTTSSAFGDRSWYYIAARTRIRPGRHPAITDQETVAIDFTDRGVVERVRVLGEADMRPVEMVSRETPTPGNERTLLQALFGNIGRVTSGSLSADTAGPGAPAPTTTR